MKRSHLALVAMILGALVLSGCYSHTYRTGARPAQDQADYEVWHHHVLYGLLTLSDDVQLEEICPNGAAVIHNRMTFLNGLVMAITFSIYTPTTVKVWCAGDAGQALHEVEVDITPELLEKARQLEPDLDEQLIGLHHELSRSRVADAGGSTVVF